MKLSALIREPKSVHDYGAWKTGDIDRASWPMKKKKLKQSGDWEWRVITLQTIFGTQLRVLLRLNRSIERFYAVLGYCESDTIRVLCSHDLHTTHGNWHCHATTGFVGDVFPGVWRDRDSLRRWPSYSGDSTVDFDVDQVSALKRAADLYRFNPPRQSEMSV